MFCPNCGKENSENKFCANCGTQLDTFANQDNNQPPPQYTVPSYTAPPVKKKNIGVRIIALALIPIFLFVAVFGGVGIYFATRDTDNNNQPQFMAYADYGFWLDGTSQVRIVSGEHSLDPLRWESRVQGWVRNNTNQQQDISVTIILLSEFNNQNAIIGTTTTIIRVPANNRIRFTRTIHSILQYRPEDFTIRLASDVNNPREFINTPTTYAHFSGRTVRTGSTLEVFLTPRYNIQNFRFTLRAHANDERVIGARQGNVQSANRNQEYSFTFNITPQDLASEFNRVVISDVTGTTRIPIMTISN
ncbi:MAG: hypothetical protein FWC80_00850 [Firmicutes bacterium]|nr:hypothetical protein [Bacillota bacterium]